MSTTFSHKIDQLTDHNESVDSLLLQLLCQLVLLLVLHVALLLSLYILKRLMHFLCFTFNAFVTHTLPALQMMHCSG